MFHRGMKWEDYLRDRKNGIRVSPEKALLNLNSEMVEVIANPKEINQDDRTKLFPTSYSQEVAKNGIESIGIQFDWALAEMLWLMESQTSTLRQILDTLQTPLATQSKELSNRGFNAYRNGWYDEALRDLLNAVEKDYRDFTVHMAIGNIYF